MLFVCLLLHPQNVINQFSRIAQDPRVSYFGHVCVGKDVSVDELRQLYSLVGGCLQGRGLPVFRCDRDNVLSPTYLLQLHMRSQTPTDTPFGLVYAYVRAGMAHVLAD